MKIKPRAENYTLDEIGGLKSVNQRLVYHLKDYLYMKRGHPMLLIGDRGLGKTFNIRKAATTMLDFDHKVKSKADKQTYSYMFNYAESNYFNRHDFMPGMFIFKKSEKIEFLEPEKLSTEEVWGKRLEAYKKDSIKDLLRVSDPIIFDDLHYMCESIIEGKLEPEVLTCFLSDVLKEVENGKNVLVVTDDMLSGYADIIQDPGLDRYLPAFGEIRPERLHPRALKTEHERNEYWKERNSINRMSMLIMPPPVYSRFDLAYNESDVETQEPVRLFLSQNLDAKTPRDFARFFGEFDDINDLLTTEKFVETARNKIRAMKIKEREKKYYLALTELPMIYSEKQISNFKRALGNLGSYSTFRSYMKGMEENQKAVKDGIKQQIENIESVYPKMNDKLYKKYKDFKKHLKRRDSDFWYLVEEWQDIERGIKKGNESYKPIKLIEIWDHSYIKTYEDTKKIEEKIPQELIGSVWRHMKDNYVEIGDDYKSISKYVLTTPFEMAFRKTLIPRKPSITGFI